MDVDDLLGRWAEAERVGAVDALDALLHHDFAAVGPAGFVLTKKQWLDRYTTGGLQNDAFDWEGASLRALGPDTVIAIGAYTSSGHHQDHPIKGSFRTTHVLVLDGGVWRIAGIHLSPRAGEQ